VSVKGEGAKNTTQKPEQNSERTQARILQKLRDAKIMADNLDKLEGWLESADENGLFHATAQKIDSGTFNKIVADMCAARKELDNDVPKVEEAYEKFASAMHTLNQKINSSSPWWRFTYSYGGPIILYFLAVLASILLAWIFFSDVISNSNFLWIPNWAFFWGTMGSTLQGFWWLWQNVSDRYFRKHTFPWYFILPVMGGVLGAIAYLLFFSGFVATTGEVNLESPSFVMLLSALAGFSSRWVVEMLDKLTKIVKISG
jgi:hypothetical protein